MQGQPGLLRTLAASLPVLQPLHTLQGLPQVRTEGLAGHARVICCLPPACESWCHFRKAKPGQELPVLPRKGASPGRNPLDKEACDSVWSTQGHIS